MQENVAGGVVRQKTRMLDRYSRPLDTFAVQTQPGKSNNKKPNRLAAAITADHLQAQGSSDRLTYHLVSVDGGGRLIEAVQEAKRKVDEQLIMEIRQQRAPQHAHQPTTLPEVPAVEASPRRRRASTIAPAGMVDAVSTTTSSHSYHASVQEAMQGEPYEVVVAAHPLFTAHMREVLREPLGHTPRGAEIVGRFRTPMAAGALARGGASAGRVQSGGADAQPHERRLFELRSGKKHFSLNLESALVEDKPYGTVAPLWRILEAVDAVLRVLSYAVGLPWQLGACVCAWCVCEAAPRRRRLSSGKPMDVEADGTQLLTYEQQVARRSIAEEIESESQRSDEGDAPAAGSTDTTGNAKGATTAPANSVEDPPPTPPASPPTEPGGGGGHHGEASPTTSRAGSRMELLTARGAGGAGGTGGSRGSRGTGGSGGSGGSESPGRVTFTPEATRERPMMREPSAPRRLSHMSSGSKRSFQIASKRLLQVMPWEHKHRVHARLPGEPLA